jgi:hypothetical protein
MGTEVTYTCHQNRSSPSHDHEGHHSTTMAAVDGHNIFLLWTGLSGGNNREAGFRAEAGASALTGHLDGIAQLGMDVAHTRQSTRHEPFTGHGMSINTHGAAVGEVADCNKSGHLVAMKELHVCHSAISYI